MPRDRHAAKVSRPEIAQTKYADPAWSEVARKTAEKVKGDIQHSHFDGGHAVEHHQQLIIRPQRIAVGLPMDELMFSQFFENYCGLNIQPWDIIITTRSTYLPDARNQIHNRFLDAKAGSHLLMLDSDVLPPPGFVDRMLKHDKPIVGGWYRKKEKYPVKDLDGKVTTVQRPIVYDFMHTDPSGIDIFSQRVFPGKGLERVDGAGAGAWLMRRDVAEALGRSPYDMNSGGEDLKLCRRITQAGFDIFVDWDAACAHCGVFYV